MPNDARAAFAETSLAAQRVAGMVAARSRGDLDGANALLTDLTDAQRAAGATMLADIALGLLARIEDRPLSDVAAELSLHLATAGEPGS